MTNRETEKYTGLTISGAKQLFKNSVSLGKRSFIPKLLIKEYAFDTVSLLSENNKVTPLSPCNTILALDLGEIKVILVELSCCLPSSVTRDEKSPGREQAL